MHGDTHCGKFQVPICPRAFTACLGLDLRVTFLSAFLNSVIFLFLIFFTSFHIVFNLRHS